MYTIESNFIDNFPYEEVSYLDKFINDSLAFLIDEKFNIKLFLSMDMKVVTLRINKGYKDFNRYSDRHYTFKWDEIKYDYTPLIEILNNEYKLSDIKIISTAYSGADRYSTLKLEKIINNTVIGGVDILTIEIDIELNESKR